MKAPNGYGSVVKLSGNRRKPFAVRKTTGWNEKGHPIYLSIGYAATREEGMILLAEYNKSPWDIDAEKITLEVLFEKWKEKKLCKMGPSIQGSLKSAFNHTKPLWEMKYKEIKSFHMQDVIDSCGRGYSTQGAIKNLFGHLDKFALELDIISKGYSALVSAEPIPETKKLPFTDEEVVKLWEHQSDPWVDTVLMFLYTGFRISELLSMKNESVDLTAGTFQGGTKTASGKNRIVPIHPKILNMVKARKKEGAVYLISYQGKKLTPTQYYTFWNEIMTTHGMKHTPHECRHTFRSWLDSAGANKVCIDLLMGHKSKEVGERIYTHKTLQELKTAVELVTG